MQPKRRTAVLGALALAFAVAGCGSQSVLEATSPPGFHVEPIDGSDVKRVVLTDETAERLGIETALVERDAAGDVVVPAAAVYYDADGATWVFTMPEPNVYVRASIKVATIKNSVASLSEGPAEATSVVTVGVQELFGTETGVGDPE